MRIHDRKTHEAALYRRAAATYFFSGIWPAQHASRRLVLSQQPGKRIVLSHAFAKRIGV